ncbi:MAG: Rne/Rng family ribonuclease [Actinobacteria bacterium]|nr:Rne/Rng family ribonuclease [Actinomycetota bacterium]
MARRKGAKGEESKARSPRKEIVVASYRDETRVAVLESGELQEIFVGHHERRSIVGDIYKGKVQNVLPGMEAAFVNIGHNRNALLYAGDIFVDDNRNKGRRDITKLLKVGQEVVVQVTKDPMGSKGARLTTYLSIPGRYLVLLPQMNTVGISHRLDEGERERLRKLVEEVRPKDVGIIVRTAAREAEAAELRKSLAYLNKVWRQVHRAAEKKRAPAILYQEPELEIKVIRDVMDDSFERVLVDSHRSFRRIKQYLKMVAPALAERVVRYADETPVFEALDINRQIRDALRREVPLPSGGSIVIDRTEALTAIDVNTGRYVGDKSLEETVLRTNIEAAAEVVRQLRLRDIGGIIIIDFIDMNEAKNRRAVLKTLNQELEKDRTKTYVVELTKLGLVEMTRKNVSEGLMEVFGEECPVCHGRGVVFREP